MGFIDILKFNIGFAEKSTDGSVSRNNTECSTHGAMVSSVDIFRLERKLSSVNRRPRAGCHFDALNFIDVKALPCYSCRGGERKKGFRDAGSRNPYVLSVN